MANKPHGTLYIGVTNSLARRIFEHKNGITKGFTHFYNIKIVVFAEEFHYIEHALRREKQLKKWNRAWKIALIEAGNPDWKDLGEMHL